MCIFSQFRVLFFYWLLGIMQIVCIGSDECKFKNIPEKTDKRNLTFLLGIFGVVNDISIYGVCTDLQCWTYFCSVLKIFTRGDMPKLFFVEILITVTEKWHSLKSVPKTELTRKPTKSAAWLTCALWNVKTSDQNCINWRWSAKMKFHPFAESSPARSEHYSIVMHSAVIAHLTASSEINITVLEPWTTYARPLRVVSSHLGMNRQCAECY